MSSIGSHAVVNPNEFIIVACLMVDDEDHELNFIA